MLNHRTKGRYRIQNTGYRHMLNHRTKGRYRIQTHAKPQDKGYRYRIQDTGYMIQTHAKQQNKG